MMDERASHQGTRNLPPAISEIVAFVVTHSAGPRFCRQIDVYLGLTSTTSGAPQSASAVWCTVLDSDAPLLKSDPPTFRRILELDQLRAEWVRIETAARPRQHRFAPDTAVQDRLGCIIPTVSDKLRLTL
jgi:hypothetical protein